jgi:hypothetical protein
MIEGLPELVLNFVGEVFLGPLDIERASHRGLSDIGFHSST